MINLFKRSITEKRVREIVQQHVEDLNKQYADRFDALVSVCRLQHDSLELVREHLSLLTPSLSKEKVPTELPEVPVSDTTESQ